MELMLQKKLLQKVVDAIWLILSTNFYEMKWNIPHIDFKRRVWKRLSCVEVNEIDAQLYYVIARPVSKII